MGSTKQAALLAALLANANQLLSTEVLIDRVWGEDAHGTARRTLQTYVARIRRILAQVDASRAGRRPRVLRRGGGYLLETDLDEIDLHRFRRLAEQASQPAGTEAARAELLREALALWQGEPLAGVPGDWAARARAGWQHERQAAAIAWAELEIRLGNPASVIAPLAELADDQPLVEALAVALIRALHAAGRTADAVDRYAGTRQRLATELGVEPGPALRAAHRAILSGGTVPGPAGSAPDFRMAVPAQLPMDVRGFTGRAIELAALDTAIAGTAEEPTAVVVVTVSGTAGVGKSALVVHWAHRVRRHFPDGQLFVNLHGFHPSGTPVRPADAIRGFLEALDVPSHRVPSSVESQIGLYRSLVDGRRILIIVDNARSAEQVRPLLPGTPGATVVVTSRNALSGLVAAAGAWPLNIDVLTAPEAREFLSRRIGHDRVAAASGDVDKIITASAQLPLALTILAARAATQPRLPLRTLAAEIGVAQRGLDAFAGDDPATDVRAVFSWSYRVLTPAAARLFRLLALHPGPDFTVFAAAGIAGVPAGSAGASVAELLGAGLLDEHRPGRYAFHDLLRGYAAEQAEAHDEPAARREAVGRSIGYYLHTAYTADQHLFPHREPITPAVPDPRTGSAGPADRDAAMTWFTEEHHVLLGVLRQAVQAGLDLAAWQLARALTTYFDLQGYWHDWVHTQQLALAAATRANDRAAAAFSYRNIGLALAQLGRADDAHQQLAEALRIYRNLGDAAGEAHTHNARARVFGRQEDHRAALEETQLAGQLFGRAGQPVMQARALNNAGWYQALLGEFQPALLSCRAALEIHHQAADRYGEANTWDSLGYIHHRLGDHEQAAAGYRTAIGLWREVGDRYNEADTLTRLGDDLNESGEHEAARDTWHSALTILEQLAHPDQVDVRARLDAKDPRSGPS
jgi:DNA-binding SARP family transcriptional activator/tetratricopeptide (TPR) repeat protein